MENWRLWQEQAIPTRIDWLHRLLWSSRSFHVEGSRGVPLVNDVCLRLLRMHYGILSVAHVLGTIVPKTGRHRRSQMA